MKTYMPLLPVNQTAAADLDKHRFVGFDGNLCGANAKALGVSETDTATGQQCPVIAVGMALVESAGAISAGDKVASDASGLAVAWSTGEYNGWALDEALGAGETIRILLAQ